MAIGMGGNHTLKNTISHRTRQGIRPESNSFPIRNISNCFRGKAFLKPRGRWKRRLINQYVEFLGKDGYDSERLLENMDLAHLALLFGIGTIAGFINVNAGGGSTLTLPALIFLGLDAALANGTNRVAIFIQNISAVASFRKRKVHQFKTSLMFALFTLPGAIIGAILATRVSNILFQRILGVILIGVVFSMFFTRSYNNKNSNQRNTDNWLIYPALVGIGFYGGFIQAGVGFLFMAALYHLCHLNLVRVNMHKVFIILIYTFPAMLVFAFTGNVNWGFGLVLAAGNALGGWWGAHAAVKGGEKVIRIILSIAITIMALKLFGLF
jgi:uncharacterized membrane protein YfcA